MKENVSGRFFLNTV